jgi:hypothetical protein
LTKKNSAVNLKRNKINRQNKKTFITCGGHKTQGIKDIWGYSRCELVAYEVAQSLSLSAINHIPLVEISKNWHNDDISVIFK